MGENLCLPETNRLFKGQGGLEPLEFTEETNTLATDLRLRHFKVRILVALLKTGLALLENPGGEIHRGCFCHVRLTAHVFLRKPGP